MLFGCAGSDVDPSDPSDPGDHALGRDAGAPAAVGTRPASAHAPSPPSAAAAADAGARRRCVDDCAEGDVTTVQTGEAPPEPTAGPGEVLCSARFEWTSPGWIWNESGTANLPSDAEGNVYFVASFASTADFGKGPLTTLGTVDSVLVKVSPACEVVWVQRYAGGARSQLAFHSVAVGATGDLIVGATLSGEADFGQGPLEGKNDDGTFADATLVLKLDRDGKVLWNRSYSSGYGGTDLFDLGVSDAGDITISGYGGTHVHLDGTDAPTDPEYTSFFIASLTGDGEPRFLHQVGGDSPGGSIEVLPSGRVAIMGWVLAGHSTAAVPDFEFSQTLYDHFLLMLDANGAPEWSQHLEQVGNSEWSGLFGGALGSTRADALVLEAGRSNYDDSDGSFSYDPEIVRELDVSGRELWSRSSRYEGHADFWWYSALAVDSHDQVVHVDEVRPDSTLDGESFTVGGALDFLVRKRDAGGDLVWTTQLGSPIGDVPWAVSTDPSDAVWVGYDEVRDDASAGAAVITKLAP